ncbi:MAG: alpha/beta hydrolase [Polyangiales bacterium]
MPARLHHERIAKSDTAPTQWLLLTHGMYGAGSNWRGIARKVNERRPEWGIVLVDLRLHGRSEDGEPPHTLAACADDIRALADELGGVAAIAGHSLGGKVMLAARQLLDVEQTWLLDSSPSFRPTAHTDGDNSVLRVMEDLEALPRTWDKRDAFVAALVAKGHELMLAQWLAMSLVPDPQGTLTLRFDLPALRMLLADYYAVDLWASIDDPERGSVEIVIADQSPVFTEDDAIRLRRSAEHVHIHHIDAGHWLHIAAPAAVVELFAQHLA